MHVDWLRLAAHPSTSSPVSVGLRTPRGSTVLFALGLVVLFSVAPLPVSALTIKLGSLAPQGSPWHESLARVAAEWERISGGSVHLKIYPGGIAGDEQDMIRKMRIGQLQAAGVTAFGLTHIHRDVGAMLLPFFIADDEELGFVLQRAMPSYEHALRQKGFQIVMWVMTGWTYVFARHPVVAPADLQRQKLWVRSGDPEETAAWQRAGFHVIPLSANAVMSSLSSGMIDAVVVSPLAAAASQWFGVAPHMCALKVSPFVGAVVVAARTWERIPPELHGPLLEAARRIGDASMAEILKADREAMAVMQKYGLSVHQVPAESVEQWRSIMASFTESLMDKSFSRRSYELVAGYLEELRRQ
jgi:TRAP-type C4-dicarboxylate transport system substrate-binding protein